MTNELYDWLRKEFYYSNVNKYKRYFEEWISNITASQIDGFRERMYRKENNILGRRSS